MERSAREAISGIVISGRVDRIIVILTTTFKTHPIYGKHFKEVLKSKAHDEENTVRIGGRVRLMEAKPLSRDRRWRLAEILERAE